jgi:hypothetical protein
MESLIKTKLSFVVGLLGNQKKERGNSQAPKQAGFRWHGKEVPCALTFTRKVALETTCPVFVFCVLSSSAFPTFKANLLCSAHQNHPFYFTEQGLA